MAELNLETFNEILLKAAKPGKEIELLEAELSMIADIFFDEISNMFDIMDEHDPTEFPKDVAEQFQKIANIKANSEGLLKKVEELKKQEGEDNE